MPSAVRPTTPQEEQQQYSAAGGGPKSFQSTYGTERQQKFTYQPPPNPVASAPGQAASAAMPWGQQNPSTASNAGGATPWKQNTQGHGHPDWGQVLQGVMGGVGQLVGGIGQRVQQGVQQWQQGAQDFQQQFQQGAQQWQQGAQDLQSRVQARIQQEQNPWLQNLIGGVAGNISKAASQFQIGRR